jgi:hypothetical protein
MDWASEPGTIADMLADAEAAGYRTTERLIRDWTHHGLLDYPHRRSSGKGHGSEAALYSASQRNLFVTVLSKRAGNNIASLARIPVGIWMYWGEEYVPLRQARRALLRWLGDPDAGRRYQDDAKRASKQRARDAARAILSQLDSADATPAARRELLSALTDASYSGCPDFDRIDKAVRSVFEPGHSAVRKAIGHPAAPVMTDSVIDIMKARLAAVTALTLGKVTDEQLIQARDAHLFAYAAYFASQPSLAAASPAGRPQLYAPVTAEDTLNGSCANLLSTLGMELKHPQQAGQLRRARVGLRRPSPADVGLVG